MASGVASSYKSQASIMKSDCATDDVTLGELMDEKDANEKVERGRTIFPCRHAQG